MMKKKIKIKKFEKQFNKKCLDTIEKSLEFII